MERRVSPNRADRRYPRHQWGASLLDDPHCLCHVVATLSDEAAEIWCFRKQHGLYNPKASIFGIS